MDRDRRRTILGAALLALTPTWAVFAAIKDPTDVQNRLTWITFGLLLSVAFGLVTTTDRYTGFMRWRRSRPRKFRPDYTCSITQAVLEYVDIYLAYPAKGGPRDILTASVKHRGRTLNLRISSPLVGGAGLIYPNSFDPEGKGGLSPGKHVLTFRDGNVEVLTVPFVISMSGRLRDPYPQNIFNRLREFKRIGSRQ